MMDRQMEYKALLAELETPPPALAYTVQRAQARAKKHCFSRRFGFSAGTLATALLCFVLLVNLMPTFALACSRVPVLRDLAEAVSWSSSLHAAVEHEYVQTIAQEQTKNGVTARVEYVIVDQKQLNIFYTLRSQTYDHLEVYPYICALDGTALEGYSLGNGEFGIPNGELRSITADFMNSDMPDGLRLTLKVADFSRSVSEPAEVYPNDHLEVIEHEDPAFVAEFTFDLRFDARFTTQGQSIPVGEAFTMDGQTLILRDAEIYPTHIRLNFDGDETNTAWLVALDFYLENERGQRFDTVSNGISATGSVGSPMMDSYRCESDFFANSQHLTLHIIGARWLDKDLERVKLDLDTVTADMLPEGVTFHQAERKENGYLLTFSAPKREGFSYSIWDSSWWGEAGEKHDIPYGSTSIGYEDAETGKYVTFEDRFVQQIPLLDCEGGTVYLQPNFSRVTVSDTPVSVTVR